MPKHHALALAGALAATLLSASYSVSAQDSRWFKVELLVFSHDAPAEAPSEAAQPEQWEATPRLAYPGAARFLIDPQRLERNMGTYPGQSVVDEFGRQIITLGAGSNPLLVVAPGSQNAISSAAVPTPGAAAAQSQASDPNSSLVIGPAEAATQSSAASLPTPFVLLPDSYLELRGKAAVMQRSGRYTTLFHQSWIQPVLSEKQSLPIILDQSGDTGQWPPLQGSIKLYLTRYLQLETNLWLNTDGSYLPGNWQMPAPPLGPPSLVVEEALPLEPAAAPSPYVNVVPAATEPLPDEGIAEVILPQDTGPQYPYRHAVLLEQKRRMRSNEIHYIDHPLFGVVIKFTPLTAPALAEIAAQQAPLPGF
jgi:hypothetical protein